MNDPLTLVSVRLDQSTVETIDQIAADPSQISLRPKRGRPTSPAKRSEIIRQAVIAGLDTLTNAEPLELQARMPCPNLTPNHQRNRRVRDSA